MYSSTLTQPKGYSVPFEPIIPADIARSWLLVNAMKTELFDESAGSRADAIILDIEDAVDPSQKDKVRENVVN